MHRSGSYQLQMNNRCFIRFILFLQILSTLCTLCLGILLLLERSRLVLAVGLISEAGRGLRACGVSLLILPPIFWLIFVGFIALWILVLGYIATTGIGVVLP